MPGRSRYRDLIDSDLESLYREISDGMIKGLIYYYGLRDHAESAFTPESIEETRLNAQQRLEADAAATHWCERFGHVSMLPHLENELEFDGYFIWSLLLTWMWGATESKMNDIVHHFVYAAPSALENSAFAKLKIGVPSLLGGKTKADIYRAILLEHRRSSGAYQERGMERFQAVFRAVGLGGDVPSSVRNMLLEMSEVRHAIVHNMGRADQKLIDSVPHAAGRYKLNTKMAVQREFVNSCAHAIKFYLLDIDSRVRNYFGRPPSESALKLKEFHLAMIEDRRDGLVCPGASGLAALNGGKPPLQHDADDGT